MKKLILSVLTFILALSSISLANCIGDISQVGNASCITEYSDDTDIENMDTVTFGSYPQSSSSSKEPIEWLVLDKQGDKALLLSKYILDTVRFDKDTGGNHRAVDENSSYTTSNIRKWLNNNFFNTAFNENDKQQILQVHIPATSTESKNNENLDIYISPEVSDKVFFLSTEECEKYFLVTQGTYGLTYFKRGAITEATNYANNKLDEDDVDVDVDTYWLRTHRILYRDGNWWDTLFTSIWIHSDDVSHELVADIDRLTTDLWCQGVRPAIWVSLSNSNSNSNPNSAGYITEERWIRANPNMPVVELKEFDKEKADKVTVTRSVWEQLPEGLKSQFREDQIIDDNVQETTKQAPKNGWDGDYYYQNDVPVKNTWVDYGSDKYYCGSTGAILKNQWIDNTYYVDNTGKMLKNTTTPDGYKVGADGKYIAETKSTLNQNVVNSSNDNLASQVAKAKCVTEYSNNTTVEQMDTVTFGSYPQSDVSGNTKEPIEWIVLEKQGDKALLYSKYILDCQCFSYPEQEVANWEKSFARQWLNNEFFSKAFNGVENFIIEVENLNKDNPQFGTPGGNNTKDKAFYLSLDEFNKYFNVYSIEDVSENSKGFATKYASVNLHIGEKTGTSLYYLRTPGNEDYVITIYVGGEYDLEGANPRMKKVGYDVRPAIWVNTSNTQIDNTFETLVTEAKTQETKAKETKPEETKVHEIKPQETKANINTTTNLSNKLISLSEEELNDLEETSLFSLTINNKYVDLINIGSMNDGFLGLFGNKKYYVRFGYKLKLPEEELVTDYGNKYNNIDGNVIDCLGNKIKKYSYWIPSYTIYTDSKQTAENIKEFIESGNDYTAYFFDAMIESTGKYKADPKSAIFKVPFTSDMVKYARPSKTPNIKLEQDDDGVELIDGYGMSVNIGKDNSEVRIEFNKNISEDLREKIMNYDLGHQTVGANIIDNYGHKILKFYYSSFGTYAIYAENYQEAEEIASELNNNDCDYTLYFYDNVKESTGKYKADKSKALFNAALTADMIKNAVYTKTKDMKVVTAENGLQIMEGLNVSVDVGKDVYEIRIELDKTYKGDLKEKIANYYFGHQDISTNIIDNYGHKILRFYDSSFGTYAINAETEEEAKEITSVLNSSNCNYVLYFFDNVIESTGKNKVDTGSAKFNVKFTKDMVKYATAKQNVERTVVKDAEGFELMDGLAVSIEEGNDLFEVRIEMNKNMSESNKNKIATYDVAHFEGYGKDVVKTKIYDNYGHRINRFYDSSFGTFMINAENLDQAKEIASELNSSTCDYTLYFFD